MPEYENNKLNGKITYSKGRIKFTLFESVHDRRTYITVRQNVAYQKEPEFSRFDVMLGITNDGMKLTLLNCYLTHRDTSMHPIESPDEYETSEYTVSQLFVGKHFPTADIELNGLSVQYHNLNEWFDISGINHDYDFESDIYEKIEFVKTQTFEGPLLEDLSYKIIFHVEKETSAVKLFKGSFEQIPLIFVEGKQKRSFRDLLDYQLKLRNLIQIGIFYGLPHILSMEGYINDDPFEKCYIYYTNDVAQRISTTINYYNMFFTFDKIRQYLPFMFRKWLKLYEKYKDVFSLYFDIIWYPVLPREGEFNNLVQALEGYHRIKFKELKFPKPYFKSLIRNIRTRCTNSDEKKIIKKIQSYANEPDLKNRLRRITDEFPYIFSSQKERKEFIKSVVGTRTYLAHREPGLQAISSSDDEMYYLIQKLHVVLVASMIKDSPFSDIEQPKLIKKYNSLRRRFRLI